MTDDNVISAIVEEREGAYAFSIDEGKTWVGGYESEMEAKQAFLDMISNSFADLVKESLNLE